MDRKRVRRKTSESGISTWKRTGQGFVVGLGMMALGASLLSGLVAKRVFGDKKPAHKSVRKLT